MIVYIYIYITRNLFILETELVSFKSRLNAHLEKAGAVEIVIQVSDNDPRHFFPILQVHCKFEDGDDSSNVCNRRVHWAIDMAVFDIHAMR